MVHAIVMPLFGELPADLGAYLSRLSHTGLRLVIVDNRRESEGSDQHPSGWPSATCWISNQNRGGLAGGLNRGVEAAMALRADAITLLDQDSRMPPPHLHQLQAALQLTVGPGAPRLLVGPCIWDAARGCWHSPKQRQPNTAFTATPLLITSGTTFAARHWPLLRPFDEGMQIDFIDHEWCFRAARQGFSLQQVHGCVLSQHFGTPHPNGFCHLLGMQLYTPHRHFTALRNLRLLLKRTGIPASFKLKESVKMLFKLPAWLLFEPQRTANLQAIRRALTAPLDQPHD